MQGTCAPRCRRRRCHTWHASGTAPAYLLPRRMHSLRARHSEATVRMSRVRTGHLLSAPAQSVAGAWHCARHTAGDQCAGISWAWGDASATRVHVSAVPWVLSPLNPSFSCDACSLCCTLTPTTFYSGRVWWSTNHSFCSSGCPLHVTVHALGLWSRTGCVSRPVVSQLPTGHGLPCFSQPLTLCPTPPTTYPLVCAPLGVPPTRLAFVP